MTWRASVAIVMTLAAAAPAIAGPRETLVTAAFATPTKAAALDQVLAAEAQTRARLTQAPNDRDAQMYHAIAIGYRAKLTRSKADAQAAKALFDRLAQTNPRDPEAQMLIGGWNLDAIDQLGGMLAGMALGAKRAAGEAALDRSVALGANQAMFPALAALMRIRLDPANVAAATSLAQQALRAPAPTPLDKIMQRSANAVLVPLRAGNGKAAQALARQLLPFGRIAG